MNDAGDVAGADRGPACQPDVDPKNGVERTMFTSTGSTSGGPGWGFPRWVCGDGQSVARPVKFANVVVPPVTPVLICERIRLGLSKDRELLLPARMPMADVAALVRVIECQLSTIEVPA